MTATIRRAEPDDARRIAEVHVMSWQAAYSTILSPEIVSQRSLEEREKMWEGILSLPEHDQTRTFVLLDDKEVLGFLPHASRKRRRSRRYLHGRVRRTVFRSVALAAGASGQSSRTEASMSCATRDFRAPCYGSSRTTVRRVPFYEATGWKFDKRDPSYRDLQRRLYPLSPSLVAEHLPSHEVARAAFEPVLDAHQLVAERPRSSSYATLTIR